MQVLQDAQKELGYTDKQVADLTETAPSTFSRYKKGETRPPLTYFLSACNVLGVSPQKINISVDAAATESDQVNENVAKQFAERIAEKNAQLEYRAGLIEALREENAALSQKLHESSEKSSERIDRMMAESKEREDRKNRIILNQSRTITILSVILAAVTVFLVYFMLDAFNGNWGLVRYIMEILPDPAHGADSGREIMGGITGLWNRA